MLRRFIALVVLLVPVGLFAAAPAAVAAGDANTSSCANEASPGFRPYMADCRGYEMVTPPYKAGARLQALDAISSDGSKLLGTGYGGFAGAGNNEQGTSTFGAGIYEFSRSPGGWVPESLQPPAAEVSHSLFVTASTDLDSTLWELVEPPQSPSAQSPPEKEILEGGTRYSLALRVHESGSPPRFEPIGPENPPTESRDFRDFTFMGASHDLSHLIFSIEDHEGAAWPGDATEEGNESLYEYVGKDNTEPRLVGVKNSGPLDGHPHINEGAELISTCGTYLGAPTGSKYNSVSATGELVFFTAVECGGGPAADTLFARVNEESTLSISEPKRPISARQGSGAGPEECDSTCEAAAPEAAVFQGASEDGDKVFFTTTQSLLNGDEGGAGNGNDLYEAEIQNGKLVKLVQVSDDPNAGQAAGLLGVVRVSADGGRVYFVAKGALTGVNAAGSTPVNGHNNLYVYDTNTGTTQFVAALAAADSKDWQRVDSGRTAQTTRDGRFLTFPSVEKLTGAEDTSTVSQLFEYDAETQRVARVSIGQQSSVGYFCPATKRLEAGYGCNGNTTESALSPHILSPSNLVADYPIEATSRLMVTENGQVFFVSLAPLTPLAVEDSKNVYEYSHENVYLVAYGENHQLEEAVFSSSFNEHDRLIGTDESGTDLFFGSVGQLVPQDTDTQSAINDARVGGGYPGVEAVALCQEASCRGSGSAAPVLSSSASSAVAGEAVVQGPVEQAVTPKPVTKTPKSLTEAQKLVRALRLCKKKAKSLRRGCETQVRRRYRAAASAKSSKREGK